MDSGYSSNLDPNSDGSRTNATSFLVQQLVGEMATATLVKVIAVHGGGVGPPPTVDVQPCVNQVDGDLNATPHGTIYGLPAMRIAAGTIAVILDPQVGDIGLACFASTDTSVVRSTADVANPGSRRRFDWADGVYVGLAVSQETPTSYVIVTADAVTIVNPTAITLQAPTITLDGDVTVTGSLTATDEVTGNGVDLSTHTHSGVTAGSDDTGPPT